MLLNQYIQLESNYFGAILTKAPNSRSHMGFRVSDANNILLYPCGMMPIRITEPVENSYMRRDNVFFCCPVQHASTGESKMRNVVGRGMPTGPA